MAHDYAYPDGSLDDRHKLLSMLGGFWNHIYEGNDLVTSLLLARAQEEKQTQQDYRELVDCLSRYTTPIFHTDHWYHLRILQSEVKNQPLRYGDGAVYGHQPVTNVLYVYGGDSDLRQHRIPLPEEVRQVPFVVNRITAPSLTLVYGVDYALDSGDLVLTHNLFDDPNVPKEPVYTGGDVTDWAISLWLARSQWDWKYLYRHFGYLIGGPKNSSPTYREFLNAAIDALAGGTVHRNLEEIFAAVTNNPVAKGDETVEFVGTDNNHLVIVTDQHSYLFRPSATPIVVVGEQVVAGQQFTDTITFHDFTRGETPEELLSLHLDTPYLVHGFAGGLTFPNKDVPLVVEEGVDGKTKVSFELGGYPTDVESFFQQLHARSGELGEPTLAELLDVRGPGQSTQPAAASLPSTINPCKFLVENVLRFHFAAVTVKASSSDGDLTLIDARILRRIIPPWQSLLVLTDMDAGGDVIDPGDGAVTENGELFYVNEPSGDIIDPAIYLSEDGQLSNLESICG